MSIAGHRSHYRLPPPPHTPPPPPLHIYSVLGVPLYNNKENEGLAIIKPAIVSATTVQVSGKVADETGLPLPGVNVLERGTTNGTVTDAEGGFALEVQNSSSVLVFSFIGYETKEIAIGSQINFEVTLRADVKKLEEVVVVGYGEQSKKMLTTSISKVNSQDISVQVVSNPADALAGMSSGVQVQASRGGYPGAAPAIRVRGVGTIGGSADVLYVVDGYPLQDADNFNQINPSDIESIEILKDAASAAIYGSRAANGVVLVTTKNGKAGKTAFDVNFYQGFQSQANTYKMMNRDEYIATVRKVREIISIMQGRPFDPPALVNTPGLPDTNWPGLVYRNAKVRDFEVSASGGNEKARFMASGGNFKQDGVMRGTSYERYTLRLNMNADLTSRLHLGVSFAPSYGDQYRMPATGHFVNTTDGGIGQSLPNIFFMSYLALPIVAPRLPNGDYGTLFNHSYLGVSSPLFNALNVIENVKNRFQNFSCLGKTFLEYALFENFTIRSTIGLSYSQINQNGYIPATVTTGNAQNANISTPALGNIWAIDRNSNAIDWLWENTATYKFTLGAKKHHHFTALAFGSVQKNTYKQVSTNGKLGTYYNSTIDNPTASTDLQGGVAYDLNAFVSLGGRLSYDYKNKYLFAVAFRRDGSSKFGPNNRYAIFPSISAAWGAIEESFGENLKGTVSDLKFRVSYGQTGNSNIGSFNWANGVVARNYVFGGVRNLGAGLNGAANNDLTWEKNVQYDYGVDIGFLHDKVTLGADYYNRLTQGMLLNKELAGIYGYARTARSNVGAVRNTGLEFNVGTNFKIKQVGWTANYNFSMNNNEVVDLGGPAALPTQSPLGFWPNTHQAKVGEPLGNIYGFVVQGLFKRPEDLAKYPQWQGNGNAVGDWRIQDTNNDGVVTELDRTKIGNGIPRYYFGATQRFTYKAFDLNIILQGVAKTDVLNANLRFIHSALYYGQLNMTKDMIDNYYDPRNPDANVTHSLRPGGGSNPNANNQATTIALQEASFLRVKNITVGYTLPRVITERLKIKRLRIYATGQNPFTFTKYDGLNPEVSAYSGDSAGNTENLGTGSSAVLAGVDFGSYPAIRIFTCGINCSF